MKKINLIYKPINPATPSIKPIIPIALESSLTIPRMPETIARIHKIMTITLLNIISDENTPKILMKIIRNVKPKPIIPAIRATVPYVFSGSK